MSAILYFRKVTTRSKHMAEQRPPIPNPVQREIRQRCRFGCVICGCPLYEYHHMVPWSETKKHVADEITLLCDKHHKEVTNGLLTDHQVADANANPFNVQKGVSSPYGLHFSGDSFTCVIGGNRFTCTRPDDDGGVAVMLPVVVDDTDLLAFGILPDGNLCLHATVFDECNLPLLMIRRNQLAYKTDTWDIDFKGATLTVREASRKIFFEITFEPPSKITINRARLLCNGVEILVRQSHIFVVNSEGVLVGNTAENCAVGLRVGRNNRGLGAGFAVSPEATPRYFMPEEDVHVREREALKAMREMLDMYGIKLDDCD